MRIPKPHWKASHKCYYVQFRRKMHRLDPDKKTAEGLYKKLLATLDDDDVAAPKTAGVNTSIQDVCLDFVAWCELHRAAGTARLYRWHLFGPVAKDGKGKKARGFCRHVGARLLVRDLKPYHVTRWLDDWFPKAGTHYRFSAITAVKRAMNWAVDEGYITESPILKMKKPQRTARGEEAYLLPEQWAQIVAALNAEQETHPKRVKPFLDAITVLKETGCRPQELRQIHAHHLDHRTQQWNIPKDDKANKGHKADRIVELGDVAYAICARLAERHLTGPIFRTTRGKPWSQHMLAKRCHELEKKLGFPICPYAIRHTFATQAIINGVDIITVSKLMGHASLTMLNRVYQHVMRASDHMKKARAKATATPAADAA